MCSKTMAITHISLLVVVGKGVSRVGKMEGLKFHNGDVN